jgi:hypothetical protein
MAGKTLVLHLAIVELDGDLVLCSEFFRPITDHADTPFPALAKFQLQFAAETADGAWFYDRDGETIGRSRTDPKYAGVWEEEET